MITSNDMVTFLVVCIILLVLAIITTPKAVGPITASLNSGGNAIAIIGIIIAGLGICAILASVK